ncbi:hypothetical protein DC094_14630 [Pelagibaculum spongiae]|uniref:DUF4397 domain-containing protein n=2 Tax=Pelagibaculum spongiae TaxID=2080658 RepID=A0A2V1GZW3_9GAMM|nr:hypothetical protein DC094_14630 [Pelagibaculum spongiae]
MSKTIFKKGAVALVVTSFLTITACGGSDSSTPVAAAPSFGAMSIVMTADGDNDSGQVSSTLTISPASSEDSFTKYNLYWGNDDCDKVGDAFTSLDKTGENLEYVLDEDTVMPQGSTHIMVFSSNGDTEMKECITMAVTDAGGLPKPPAATFTDPSTDVGTINTTVAVNELTYTEFTDDGDATDDNFDIIDGYVVYWGSNATTKLNSTALKEDFVKGTSADSISVDLGAPVAVPTGATHLLVYSYVGTVADADRVESTMARAVRIADAGFPTVTIASVSFNDVDYDKGQIQGDLEFSVTSGEEDDFNSFNIYFGDGEDKVGAAIGEVATVSGTNEYTFSFSENTQVPELADNFLLFPVKDSVERIGAPVEEDIVDNVAGSIPGDGPGAVTFFDGDVTADELSGTVTIAPATDETDVDEYVLYWATDNEIENKLYETPITRVATNSEEDVTATIPLNTVVPAAATHIVIVSSNAVGESTSETDIVIANVDNALPAAPGLITLVDNDTDGVTSAANDKLENELTFAAASEEVNITHYAIYWGDGANSILQIDSADAVIAANVSKTDLSFNFADNVDNETDIPTGATHVLVVGVNAHGNSATASFIAIDQPN